MLADKLAAFREGQYEVQKERGLQKPGDFIGPEDAPVESVELADVVQRVEDERYQAEDVKVSGAHGSPAPQQHVKANAQVDERNQPQPIVHRPLGWNQYHFHIQRHRTADQRVGGLGPDARIVEPVGDCGRTVYGAAIDADNLVSPTNSRALRRAIRL